MANGSMSTKPTGVSNTWTGDAISFTASNYDTTLEHSGLMMYVGDATNAAWGLVQLILNSREVVKFQSGSTIDPKQFGKGCFHVCKGDQFRVVVANGSSYSVKMYPTD